MLTGPHRKFHGTRDNLSTLRRQLWGSWQALLVIVPKDVVTYQYSPSETN
jgi:hypothetical protein